MKPLLTAFFVSCFLNVFAQTVPVQQPIEERYPVNYWWWILGVLLAIGVGILVYMLIKKDPKKDVVR